jgi:hypothetical protein
MAAHRMQANRTRFEAVARWKLAFATCFGRIFSFSAAFGPRQAEKSWHTSCSHYFYKLHLMA